MDTSSSPKPQTIYLLAHTIGWCLIALIIYGSLTSTPIIQDTIIGDKTQHFLAYFVTMAWFAQLFGNSKRLLAQGLFLAVLAAALEFAQAAGGHRTYELLDMLTGIAGVLGAMAMPKTILDRLLLATGLAAKPVFMIKAVK